MKVSVEIHGFLQKRSINVKKEFRIKEGSTTKDALSKVSKKLKVDLLELLTKVNPVVMINNERMEIPEDLFLKLADGDEIVILQPLAGG
ncbi:MAG: MoaD/ThiS family protein [Halobacteriota archaeon]|nr:MoaD/ThiS family protein [Halobacteriota archaeon]